MKGVTVKNPETMAEARRLRDEGFIVREIAVRLGVARSTVQTWLVDPDGSRTRARKDSYAGVCIDCGGLVSGQAGIKGRRLRCFDCGSRHGNRLGTATNRFKAQERYTKIAAMWRAGASRAEIAAALDTTQGSIGVTIHRMRQQGWDLPYRYRMVDGRRVAASSQLPSAGDGGGA